MTTRERTLLSWSSGKDSAWALHVLRQRGEFDVVGLLTTTNEAFDRVAMHAVRRDIVEAQARATGLPLRILPLPWPCPNGEYERRFAEEIRRARADGVTRIAFGDLFLEDIRAYRIAQLQGTGVEPIFPIWGKRSDTPQLARDMVAAGLRAAITCVDPKQLDRKFAGREFDAAMLADLPANTDPCGENGEFHTLCYAGPMFRTAIPVLRGEVVDREGFCFADFRLATRESA